MPYPQDPNHPLNARPNYIPGQASFASPGYSGYGGTPQGYQPAQAGPADYIRSPQTFGVDPKVKAMSGSAFGQGQAMAKLRDPVNMDAGRMAASLAKTTAPMTPGEHRDILASYGERGYMGSGGLLASVPKLPASKVLPGQQAASSEPPAAPQGLLATSPSPAAIGASPFSSLVSKPGDFGSRPMAPVPNLDLRLKHAKAQQASLQAIQPVSPPLQPAIQPMASPPPAAASSPFGNASRFIGSADMVRWYPEIRQEDALRSRILAAQASAMEQRSAMHPLVDAVLDRGARPDGYLTFDQFVADYNRARGFADAERAPGASPFGQLGLASATSPGRGTVLREPDAAAAQGRLDRTGLPTAPIRAATDARDARQAAEAAGAQPGTQPFVDAGAVYRSANPQAAAQTGYPDMAPMFTDSGFLADLAGNAARLINFTNPFIWGTAFKNPFRERADETLDAAFVGADPGRAPRAPRLTAGEVSRGMPYPMFSQGPAPTLRPVQPPRNPPLNPLRIERLY